MSQKRKPSVTVKIGYFWLTGWLFTIGFSGLSFWKGALGILIWPYFLGSALAGLTGSA